MLYGFTLTQSLTLTLTLPLTLTLTGGLQPHPVRGGRAPRPRGRHQVRAQGATYYLQTSC